MRWTITLEGAEQDIARLCDNLPDLVHRVTGEAHHATVTLIDPEDGATGDAGREAAHQGIESLVTRLNGVAKLKWGRAFGGVRSVASIATRPDGSREQVLVVGTAKAYLLYEDLVRLAKAQGSAEPKKPRGLTDVNQLRVPGVLALAEGDATAARLFRLLDLALTGEYDLDWVLAYSTLDVVAHDATERGADGRALGWWTKREMSDFKATANSPHALGVRARHGAGEGVTTARMSDTDAAWFLRRVVARWVAWRLEGTTKTDGPPIH